MSKELIHPEAARFEEQYKVIELYAQNLNPLQIAKQLRIKRVEVMKHIEEFRVSNKGSRIAKDRLDELLMTMDAHFGSIIRKFYEIVEEIDAMPRGNHQLMAQKNSALRQIADIEQKRIDMLQRSGVLEAADMTAAVEEMQSNIDKLMTILSEELCDTCRSNVWSRLGNITGKVEPIVVYQDNE